MPSEELIQEIEQAAEQVVSEAKEQSDVEQESEADETTTDQIEQVTAEETDTEETVIDDSVAAGDDKGDTEEESAEADTQHAFGEQDDEPSVPDLSDEIIARGISAGMTLNDVLSFPDEAALNRVVTAAERVRQTESQAKDGDDAITEDPFADLKLDPDKYDPEMVELMGRVKSVLEGQHEQIQAFKEEQEQTSRAAQSAAAQEIEQWFDGQTKKLGDDFADALGTGGYRSLDRGSPQFANRDAIAETMTTMLAGYGARGIEAPPREEVFDAAARLVLANKFQEVSEKRLAGDLAKRSTQHIQRVGGTKAKGTKSAEDETAALIDEKFGR
jgi:hypothetical protein